MNKRDFFRKINFNKVWSEEDWELYFQAQEAYRVSAQTEKIRKEPISRIKFVGDDEVDAFDPVLREYGVQTAPDVLRQIQTKSARHAGHAEEDYFPTAEEDAHIWGEGVPLGGLPIYRDACRFAVSTSNAIHQLLKRRDAQFRRNHTAEFENLRFHANWTAISVAQGHLIGYAKDRICGNIARCRRALQHADRCVGLINRVSRHTGSRRIREDLFSFAAQLRNALYLWIDELRDRHGWR